MILATVNNKRPERRLSDKKCIGGIKNPHDEAMLVKFFEILIEVDQRQKRDGKNNGE
jgi:hypothetical protein